jgi:hypothetical protein
VRGVQRVGALAGVACTHGRRRACMQTARQAASSGQPASPALVQCWAVAVVTVAVVAVAVPVTAAPTSISVSAHIISAQCAGLNDPQWLYAASRNARPQRSDGRTPTGVRTLVSAVVGDGEWGVRALGGRLESWEARAAMLSPRSDPPTPPPNHSARHPPRSAKHRATLDACRGEYCPAARPTALSRHAILAHSECGASRRDVMAASMGSRWRGGTWPCVSRCDERHQKRASHRSDGALRHAAKHCRNVAISMLV